SFGFTLCARSGCWHVRKCHCSMRATRDRSASRYVTWRLAKDDGHVVEVAPDGLKRRLAHPVLRAELRVVDPDGRRRDAAQGDGVFGQRIPDPSAIPGGPGA